MNFKHTCNSFGFILGNQEKEAKYITDLAASIVDIEKNYNLKNEPTYLKIKCVKSQEGSKKLLRVETTCFITAESLADAVHEVLPFHGVAVLPWLESEKFL